ncbi:MAG: right-handed parallel beta-helix repeat-containing protein [Verrucomicrobiia bacterium]
MNRILHKLPAVIALALAGPLAFGQGPLTPPGPPAPMMRTLDQIEPRIPITNLPWTVTAPGSYYVVTNLVGDPVLPDGIIVQASDVTIDLKGFTLQGGAGGGNGINVSGGVKNLKVFNGVIRNWTSNGISSQNADNGQLTDLRVSNNGASGISVGMGWTVAACQCLSNATVGLYTQGYCTIKDCTAAYNAGGAGFSMGGYCVLTGCAAVTNMLGFSTAMDCSLANCTAGNNGQIGFFTGGASTLNGCSAGWNGSNGFVVTPACRLANCTAMWNQGNGFDASIAGGEVPGCKISGCTAAWNQQNGIVVTATGSIVENCVASRNTLDGIYVGSRCFILLISCDSNGRGGLGWAGIRVTGSFCRIDGNSVMLNNGPGIFTGPVNNNCFIVRNTAHGNLVNYGLAAGTFNAQIIAIAAGGFISTDPLANFTY